MDKENIALLGATGSIGASTFKVVAAHPERFHFWALAAGSNAQALAALCEQVHPEVAAIADEGKRDELKSELQRRGLTKIEVLSGDQAMSDIAAAPEASTVVEAIVGAAGVRPAFAAAQAGQNLLLANKEAVVCGGGLLMECVAANDALLLPIDSEHNAIFQCLEAATPEEHDSARLWLTCSGGPFHAHPEIDLEHVTPAMALKHPTWHMGHKISIDSATLMNKGLEVIEARWLFDVDPSRIQAVIHPQSVVHSMVEYADGAIIAQMGSADMCLPICYCLGYPERMPSGVKRLDLYDLPSLSFTRPDTDRFPQLAYAYEALAQGGTACIALNAANEIGVQAFLEQKIGFRDIARVCRAALDHADKTAPANVDDVMAADHRARQQAREWVARQR